MNKSNRTLQTLRASGRARIVVLILAGVLVTVILLALLYRTHVTFERELTATFQRHQLTTAQSLAAGVEEVFAEAEEDLRGLARHEGLLSETAPPQDEIDAYFETHTDILNNITVVNAEGNAVCRSPKTPKKHNVSKWPEFLGAKQTHKTWIGEPTKCVIDTTETVVRIFVPVVENGRFNGAIYTSINLKKLWAKCMKRVETGRESVCWVMADNGQLLYHPNSEYVGLTWEQIEAGWRQSREAAGDEIDEDIEELAHRGRKRVQDGQEGTAEYLSCLEGVEELVAFTPIRLGNRTYGLAVVTPKSQISAPIAVHAKVTYGLMAGLAALCVAGGYVVYRGGRARILLAEEKKHANALRQSAEALRESERKYRHLFDHLVDAAFLADAETGLIIETNRQGEKLFGRSRDEIVGMHQSDLHPSDKAEQYRRLFAEHLGEARALDAEAEVVRKDGTTVPVQISASTMTIEGRCLMLGIFRDITERKKAEETLRESEERYRNLVQNQGEGIGFVDTEENFTFANPAGHKIFGVPPGGLIGRNLREFVDEETFALIQAQTKVRQAGEKSIYEIDFDRPDGQKCNLLVTATPRFDSEGQFIGTFGIFRDITNRKRAEEKIEKSQRLLEAVIEAIPDATMVIAADYRVVLANRAARAMAGVEDPVAAGLRCHQVFHHRDIPCDGVEYSCPLVQVVATKGPVVVTHTRYDAEGNEVLMEVAAAPIFNEAGELVQIVQSCRDITERVEE